jgi:hypothetical protein
MSKGDLASIIVRTTGLIFLALVIIELPKLISTIIYAIYLYPEIGEILDTSDGSGESLNSSASLKSVQTMLMSSISQCLIYLVTACYFIFFGNTARQLLLR